MTRDVRLYIQDILESIDRIEEYTRGVTREAFAANALLQDGVSRRLAVIGEAVTHIPQPIRDANPDIPWRDIARMRNILIHVYFGIELDRVWKVVAEDLGELKKRVLQLEDSLE